MPTSRQKTRFLLTQTKAEFRTVFLPLLFKINTKFNFARQLQCQAFLLNNVPDRQRTESCLHLNNLPSSTSTTESQEYSLEDHVLSPLDFFFPLLATTQIQLGQEQAEMHPFGEGICTRAVTYHLLGLSPPAAQLLLATEEAPLGSMSSPQPACPKPTVLCHIVPKKFPPVPGLSSTPPLPIYVQAPRVPHC